MTEPRFGVPRLMPWAMSAAAACGFVNALGCGIAGKLIDKAKVYCRVLKGLILRNALWCMPLCNTALSDSKSLNNPSEKDVKDYQAEPAHLWAFAPK